MAQAKRWSRGEVMVRREVLNDGRAWAEIAVIVVEDTPGLLATYVPEGAPLRFPPGEWPTLDGLHPWHGKERWRGHGVLMLHRPGESYAVWVFWFGSQRTFRGWYINLQEPFRRTELGYDTQDLELDIWMPVEGGWVLKGRRGVGGADPRRALYRGAGRSDSSRSEANNRRVRCGQKLVVRRLGRVAP